MKELSTGASCNRDAEKLAKEIEKALAQEEKIIIDFEEIDFFSAVFFNHAFLHYAKSLGKQKYDDTFFLINLDEIGEEDYNDYFEDTMRAGHYKNDAKAVELMIRSSNSIIRDLLQRNVTFERTETGELDFTREGAHSQPRILFSST